VSEFRECVESRLAARGGGVEGHELLDAAETLLKGGERFLKILVLLVTLLRNSILSSSLGMSSSFLMSAKRFNRYM
jgi:hypothetical protein